MRIMSSSEFNPSEALEQSRIDPNEEVSEPISAIQINSSEGFTPSLTLGNFSMITGKAKSKKTFLIGAISAAAITGETIIGVVQGVLLQEKRNILYFDTEQSRPHTIKSVRRIIDLSGGEVSENFHAFGLRRYDPDQRLEIIELALERYQGVGLVFIDGGRDLLSLGINDERLATKITSSFLRWTELYNMHLCIVLHQNKKDVNPRGHFGTECMNKAETVFSVTAQNNGSSVVSCDYSRYIPFKDFAFRINEAGLPESCSIPIRSNGNNNSTKPEDIAEAIHSTILNRLFNTISQYRYSDFWTAIKLAFEGEGVRFGVDRAKKYPTYYYNQGWVSRNRGIYTCIQSEQSD